MARYKRGTIRSDDQDYYQLFYNKRFYSRERTPEESGRQRLLRRESSAEREQCSALYALCHVLVSAESPDSYSMGPYPQRQRSDCSRLPKTA